MHKYKIKLAYNNSNSMVLKRYSVHDPELTCLVTVRNSIVLKPQNTVSARVAYIDLNDYGLNDISLGFSSQICCQVRIMYALDYFFLFLLYCYGTICAKILYVLF